VIVPFASTLDIPAYCHAFTSGNCLANFDELLQTGLLKGFVRSCCSVRVRFMSCLTHGVNYQTVFAH
jgi:hypothetical protein